MNTATLVKMFDLNHHALGRNTEGVTHEESLVSPPSGGSSLNRVVGHIVESRSRVILPLLDREPLWSPEKGAPYARGRTLARREDALPFEEILAELNRLQPIIKEGIESLGDPRLAEPVEGPTPGDTVGEKLLFLQFHEAYHVGQTGVLRRLAGKPGAIA